MNDNLDPNNSPQDLLKKPSSKIGVKKLNKLPLIIVITSATIVFLSLGYAMYQRGQINRIKQNNEDKQTDVSSNANAVVASLLKQLQEQDKKKTTPKEDNKSLPVIVKKEETKKVNPLGKPTDKQIDDSLKKEALRLKKLKEKLLMDAINSPTKLKSISAINSNTKTSDPISRLAMLQALAHQNKPNIDAKLLNSITHQIPQGTVLKNELWMENAKRSYDYIKSKKSQPISPYEIKAGTIIPGILITSINSQLPGQVLGQVSENVYDTATGKFLLIPQGTKVVGIYNADVSYGQKRVMIAWNRLIFPDGQTLNIGAMNGTDQAGHSGFEDQVDNHYFRIFGSAFLMTLLNGDMSINKGGIVMRRESSDRKETAMEKAASRMVEKNMNVAPTIKIRSGYKFNIFVTKDMILEALPYSVNADNYNQAPQSSSIYRNVKRYHSHSPYYSGFNGNSIKSVAPAISDVAKVK